MSRVVAYNDVRSLGDGSRRRRYVGREGREAQQGDTLRASLGYSQSLAESIPLGSGSTLRPPRAPKMHSGHLGVNSVRVPMYLLGTLALASSATRSHGDRLRSLNVGDATMKVEPSIPVLVVSGRAEDEKHAQINNQLWFPALIYRVGGSKGTDNLLLSFKTDCDCTELPIDIGMNGRDFVSTDSGQHWYEVSRMSDTNEATGLVRPCFPSTDGATICLTRTVHSHTPVAQATDNRTAYLAAQVFSESGRQVELYNASLSFPFELDPYPRGNSRFTYSLGSDGNTLTQPDGSTLMTLYGGVAGANVIIAMRTVDGGRHFDYYGTVANSTKNARAHVSPNCMRPTETSMTLLDDEKTILSVWRSIGTNHPLCATTSTTLGKSWSIPRPLQGPYGVEPKILRLNVGAHSVLVISSGRVGLRLHFSGDDWTGKWQAFDVAEAHNQLVKETDQHFPLGFVNRTQKSCRTAALACSTSYTGLTQLHGPSANNTSNVTASAHIMVSYDLINSPKGLNYIFVMQLSLSLAEDTVRITPQAPEMPANLKTDDSSPRSCARSDARMLLLQQTLCTSIGGFTDCQLAHNLTAEGDWPNQAVYMQDLLQAVVAPDTCLNTPQAKETIAFLNIVDPTKSGWWSTWVQFQVQYYDMPRKPGARIESPATLGRKCWAFAYLRQVWGPLKPVLEVATTTHGLSLRPFITAWDSAVALTMPLCHRTMANCFVNKSYDVARNGTCPEAIAQFLVGFTFEDQGGGRNDSTGAIAAGPGNNVRSHIAFPFPKYCAPDAFEQKLAAVQAAAKSMVSIPKFNKTQAKLYVQTRLIMEQSMQTFWDYVA